RYSFTGANGTFSSGPAVTIDKVLVGYGDGLGNGGIKALRRSDGQEQWDFPANNNCASSPAVNGNSVYIGCRDGKVYSLNLANGNKLWERSLNTRVDSSPAVAYGLVFAGNCAGIPSCNGIMYALYETNGSVAWQYSVNGGNINSGAAVSGGAIFFATQQSMELVSLNATQGTLIWRKNLTGPMDMTPSVHAGKVFIGTGNGTSSKMLAINVTNGNKVWEYPVVGNLFSSPAVASGKVIFGTSEPSVLALNEATGQSVWSFTAVQSNVFSSPAIYENHVAFGDLANRFYVLGPDNTLPTITGSYPADNQVNFPVGDNFTVSFSEGMDTATAAGQYSLAPSGGNLTHSWDVDNKILSIMHPQALLPETNYTITILAGFTDAHGNALAAGKTIKFRTRDVTPPRLLSYSPTGNITDAPVNQTVTLVFNEAMSGNATCTGVGVVASAGGNTQKKCAWSADLKTVDITPDPQWTGNNRYDIQVTKGAVDVAGNAIVNPTQFSFTTKDTSPPQVLNVDPANNALNVPTGAVVKVRFNEPIDQASFEAGLTMAPAVTGSYSYNGTESAFVPGAALAGDTEYTVQLLGVKDVVGNAMPSAFVWKFRTKDTAPPTFTKSEPGTGAVEVPRNVIIRLYFNEKMDAMSLESAVTMSNVPTVDANWDDAGGFANITPGTILEEGKTYSVNVSTGAKDLAGNGLSAP
ncbi:MAG TPA: Ig-like domain-containing protein, partial [Thermoplasmata archaeon]|nr:Ig-like domain-containing protein [Thermoplasmata archaeon]